MEPMNRTTSGSAQPVQTSQAGAQTDMAAEHKGILNGLTVEVKPIQEGQINGITVDRITKKIPVKTRIVKLAKAFVKKVKSLRHSNVKKSVEHKLAGQEKRAMKHQNWSQISPEREKELLFKVKFDGAREELRDRIDSFNQKLNLLQQLKGNIKSLETQNLEFETTYATAIEAAKKSLKGKSLPKGLVVAMPPGEGKKDPQYVQITAKDSASRREAVQELGKIFRDSDGYKNLLRDRQTITQYKREREDLKKEIKDLERDMKALYKGYKNDWVKQDKAAVNTQAVSDLTSKASKLSEEHAERVAGIESEITQKTSKMDGLRVTVTSMTQEMQDLEGKIQTSTVRLGSLDRSLSKVEADRDSVIDEVKPIFNEDELASKKAEAEALRVEIAGRQNDIVALRGNLKAVNSNITKETKELKKLQVDQQKLEAQYAKAKKALEKEIDGQIKTKVKAAHENGEARYKEFSAYVGGESDKRQSYESPAPAKSAGSPIDKKQ